MSWGYLAGDSLPALTLTWKDASGNVRDLSSGYSATAQIATVAAPGTILATKSTGITLAATAPNVTVAWNAAVDFAALTPDIEGTDYVVWIRLTRSADLYKATFRPLDPPTITLRSTPA